MKEIDQLAADLRQGVVRLARQLRSQGDSHELSAGALSCLGALGRHGSMTVGDLARHEGVTPPMITKIGRLLDADDLIVRRADAEDGRVTRLELSAKGRHLVERRRSAAEMWLVDRLGELTPAERDTLAEAQHLLARLAERQPSRARP